MNPIDLFEETYAALSANKVRSGLTVLGIVIGISSVIAMISIGKGAESSIQDSIKSIGSNLVIVVSGAQQGPGVALSGGRGSAKTLTLSDSEAIEKEIGSTIGVAPEVTARYQVAASGKNTNTQVVGVTPSYPAVRNFDVSVGSFITDQDMRRASKVAVIGPTVRNDLFGADTSPIGQTVRIKNTDFRIIGITKQKGGTGFSNPDEFVLIPLSTAQRYLSGDTYVTLISVAAKDTESTMAIQEDIIALLLRRHKISDPGLADFSTINQTDIISAASAITETFTILLGAVAGISLLVGGIGIMNMMLTTVTERTKEIGLRKAVGAKRRDINLQFLSEAVFLTLVGGIFGIILGLGESYAATYFDIILTEVSASSVFLAFGVSAAIGILFGYYPARRAAELNPIDALRYE